MPSTVKVRITAARHLPLPEHTIGSHHHRNKVGGIMSQLGATINSSSSNSSSISRDPYVVVSLGGQHASPIASQSTAEEERAVSGTTTSTATGNKKHQHAPSSAQLPQTPGYTARTRTCRRTLAPVWDEEFRFDCSDDTLLQDEPLIFKVFDASSSSGGGSTWTSTTTSSSSGGIFGQHQDDVNLGQVYVDLNPLLTSQSDDDDDALGSIDGWFPLYDTLSGVCGELLLSVKLNFIGDVNPFRDSSAGVRLLPFSTIDPESGFVLTHVNGFVEELVVADDPEFEWNSDENTTSRSAQRTSHENRQTLLYLLDWCVRRRMCKTVLEMGGNAVLGFHQNFDVEGDSGIVARTYGTCVLLERRSSKPALVSGGTTVTHHQRLLSTSAGASSTLLPSQLHHHRPVSDQERLKVMDRMLVASSSGEGGGAGVINLPDNSNNHRASTSTAGTTTSSLVMRSSAAAAASEVLPLSGAAAAVVARHRENPQQEDVQLLTLSKFDAGVRVRFGGLVTARSVKYLGNLASKL